MLEGEVLGPKREEQIVFYPLEVESQHWQYSAKGETLKCSGISSGCETKSAQLPFIPQETGISNYVPFFFVLLFHSANNKLLIIKTALSWPASSTG